MPYYPKSQVKTNLYTKGGEFQLKSTKQKYSGYYWKNSKGEIFTKKNPNVGGSELLELIPEISTPSTNTITYVKGNNVYNSLKKVNIADSLFLPSYQKPSPTSKDYDLGNFNRFFAKKTNENLYIEVSKNVYNKLNQKNKAYDYKSYLIFPLTSVGIVVTTTILGMLLYKEILTKRNLIGIAIAIVSILIISL